MMGAAARSAEYADGGRTWFVCTTHWRQEKLALENLQRQKARDGAPLFEPYLPMHQQMVRPRGQPERIVPLPFFPRYLFVNVDVGQPCWTQMYSTRGIAGVIPSGKMMTRVIERLVGDLRRAEVAGFLKLSVDALPCRWKPEEKVTYGGFIEAVFKERVDEKRARILVSLLGSDSTVVVDIADLSDSAGIESRVVR